MREVLFEMDKNSLFLKSNATLVLFDYGKSPGFTS